MTEEACFRCGKSGNVSRLLDAIYGSEIAKICEECALMEGIPIIRKPSSFQLEAATKPYSVHERLSKMAGMGRGGKKEAAEEKFPVISLDKLRKPKDYSEMMKKREERAKARNTPLDLIDNYNWVIQRARRSRKMNITHLGPIIGENESVIKMIEDGFLPDDADRIIKKIEQFFKISLRKSGKMLEETRIEQAKQPARILNFNPQSLKDLTIQDLKKLKEHREQLEKEEAEKEYASKVIWQGKSKSEREQDILTKEAGENKEEIIAGEQETNEEKKSKKSFWDIFKRKNREDDVKNVFVGADISEIDVK